MLNIENDQSIKSWLVSSDTTKAKYDLFFYLKKKTELELITDLWPKLIGTN